MCKVQIGSTGYYNFFGDADSAEDLELYKCTIVDETSRSWIAKRANGVTVKVPKKSLNGWQSIEEIKEKNEISKAKRAILKILEDDYNFNFDLSTLKFIEIALKKRIIIHDFWVKKHQKILLNKPEFREAMRNAYEHYIASERWKNTREEVRKRDQLVCQDCNELTKRGVCHHKSYENWGKGNFEEIDDCVWLCQQCHAKRHNCYIDENTPFWAKRSFDGNIIELEDLKSMYMNEI